MGTDKTLLKQDDSESYLICDDSIQDKRYSRFIELVKRQYSGNEHGTVKGIGLVNLIHFHQVKMVIFIQLIIEFTRLKQIVKPRMTIFRKCFFELLLIKT